jgi:release factor glutamine methyltransferase
MTAMVRYRFFQQQLQDIYSQSEAGIITDWVFQKIAGLQRSAIIKNQNEELNDVVKARLDSSLAELLQHKPVQYVLGEAWFYKMKLKVNEHVLIPRPETEELVQWMIDTTAEAGNKSILDIGTGSGCIAIAIQKKIPGICATAIDLSNEALQVAKENAAIQNTAVDFLQLDFLDEKKWGQLARFDIIVSNPPYIPEAEKNRMDENVVAYEPSAALFVPDNTPLLFYEKIAAFGLTHLNPGGKIFVEIHQQHAAETAACFATYYPIVEIKKDFSGNDRMLMAVLL